MIITIICNIILATKGYGEKFVAYISITSDNNRKKILIHIFAGLVFMELLPKVPTASNEIGTIQSIPQYPSILTQPPPPNNYSRQTMQNWPTTPNSMPQLMIHRNITPSALQLPIAEADHFDIPHSDSTSPICYNLIPLSTQSSITVAISNQQIPLNDPQPTLLKPISFKTSLLHSSEIPPIFYQNIQPIPNPNTFSVQSNAGTTQNPIFLMPSQPCYITYPLQNISDTYSTSDITSKYRIQYPFIQKKSSYEFQRIKKQISQIEDFEPHTSPPYIWMLQECGKLLTQKQFIQIYGTLKSKFPPRYAPTRDVSRNQKLRLNWMAMIWKIPQCQTILKYVIREHLKST